MRNAPGPAFLLGCLLLIGDLDLPLQTQLIENAHQEVIALVVHPNADLHELASVAAGEVAPIWKKG